MVKKIGINGFGRIGRLLLRLGLQVPGLEFVGINDIMDTTTAAHLFKYDSTYGPFKGTVSAAPDAIIVNGKKIPFTQIKEPDKIPWDSYGTEIVYESTGVFTKRDGYSKHFAQKNVRLVMVSAPADKEIDATIVFGVNNEIYKPGVHKSISAASCTTNCLAPVAKVLQDHFGIKRGFMTTVHAFTNDQRVLDFPHKDLRRARTASTNVIPTTTGAAKAIGEVIPALKGKMDGMALRVPVPDGSLVDLTIELEKPATKEEINAAMKTASEGSLKGILGYTEDEIVSTDVIGSTYGSLFDAKLTNIIGGTFVKVLSWYDNEASFTHQSLRVLDKLA